MLSKSRKAIQWLLLDFFKKIFWLVNAESFICLVSWVVPVLVLFWFNLEIQFIGKNMKISSMLLFKDQIRPWWDSQNSENQQIIHRELMPQWKGSVITEFQKESGAWDSIHPLFYRYRKSGLASNVHLFGRCYSGCIMYGTSFHARSKSNKNN